MEHLTKSLKKANRIKIAHGLANIDNPPEERCAVLRLMEAEGVDVTTVNGGLFRLNLLGRSATCTSSAGGAISNWIAAVKKEAGGA